MFALIGEPSNNSTSRYPTIGRSEASDARTPNAGMIWNLNPDFNIVRLHIIMKSIQHMALEGSPLVAMAQQGAEVANLVVADWPVTLRRSLLSVIDQTIGQGKLKVK
jgi:hypothetical protein